MQTDGGGEQATIISNTILSCVEDEGASGSVPEVSELPEADDIQNEFSELNDKSEMSDEDFRSIKTVDDNANDFEGKKNIDRDIE